VNREYSSAETARSRCKTLELKKGGCGEEFNRRSCHPVDLSLILLHRRGRCRISPEELARRHDQIPRDSRLILYALNKRSPQAPRVRSYCQQRGYHECALPLAGGLAEWEENG